MNRASRGEIVDEASNWLVRGVRRLVTELRRHERADREAMRVTPAAEGC
jgi:hypothetical protein